MDPIATANYGMMAASRRFEASTVRLSQAASPDMPSEIDIGQAVVEMSSAKQQMAAAVQVAKVADEMTGELIDLIA